MSNFEVGQFVFNSYFNLYGVVVKVEDRTNQQPVMARQFVTLQTAEGTKTFTTDEGNELVWRKVDGTPLTDATSSAIELLSTFVRSQVRLAADVGELRMQGYAKDRALEQFKESVAEAFDDADGDVWEILSDLGIDSEIEVSVQFTGSATITIDRQFKNDEHALTQALIDEGISKYDIDTIEVE